MTTRKRDASNSPPQSDLPHKHVAQHITTMTTAAASAPQRRVSSSTVSKDALSAALEAVGARPRRTQRRPTKPAPYELANHARAFIEGHQCMVVVSHNEKQIADPR